MAKVQLLLSKNKQSSGKGPWKGSIDLAGREVPYTVRASGRARYVRLQVGVGTGLEVVTPGKFDPGDLDGILRRKQKWILDKLGEFGRVDEKGAPIQQQVCRRVPFCGREYEVETRVGHRAAPGVTVEESKLMVTVPEGAEGDVRRVLEQWLRSTARVIIRKRVQEVSEKLNLAYNQVFIKGQKTRWGSCSSKRNLNFNWRLVMAPEQVQDYIIVHELIHLVEPNHSERFWALVEKACPDYKAHRAWLRKNGRLLSL